MAVCGVRNTDFFPQTVMILRKGGKRMFGLFGKKKNGTGSGKPKAVAFVDYEHWYISLDKMYHTRPDLKAWRDELTASYEVQEIIFFADFSNPSIKQEIPKIREITNYIIETQNTSTNFKKDFTDFIMLDHIYQKAMNSPEIGNFILFSGDGHFNSVVNFLITQLGKTVGVYGIENAMSNQLRNSASWYKTLPEKTDPQMKYYTMILKNLKYLQDKAEIEKSKVRPTFWPTVEAVCRINKVKRSDVSAALKTMIEKGYIYQKDDKVEKNKTIKILCVNWEKCRGDGISAS